MYTLYGGGFTRAHMTEMVFRELDVPYEVVEIDTLKNKHRTPEFLQINPAGWVPALKTPDGAILYETAAINLYLADRYGTGNLAPAIDDPDRGAFLSALFYLTDELEPALKRYFYPHRYSVRDGDTDMVRELAGDAVRTCLSVVDQRLQSRGPFHLGNRYSLADLTLAYWVTSMTERNIVAELSAVQECVDCVAARAAIQSLFSAHIKRAADYATRNDGPRSTD